MSRFRWRHRSLPWILFFFGFVPLLQAEEAPLPGSQVRFDRVSLEHGLSQSSVTAIVQDSEGFLWFGTRSGLDRFDGYEFRIFRNDPDRPETLSHSAVTALFTDSRDRLWVGTEAGLNRYDPLTGSFLRFLSGRDSPSGPGGNTVTALAEDRRGRLWIGTPRGLIVFDPVAGRFTIHLKRPGDPRSLNDNRITSLLLDGNGALWVGTLGGLSRMDTRSGICLRVNHRDDDPASLVSDRILAIHEDRTGRMWIGTDMCLDLMLSRPTSEKPAVFAHVRPGTGRATGEEREVVRDICDGGRGELWIATGGGGLCRMTWSGTGSPLPRMEHFRHDPQDPASLSSNAVLCLALDRTGMLWAGTDGGGANKANPVKSGFLVYQVDPSSDPADSSRRRILSVYEDISGVLWFGTGRGIVQPADMSGSPALCRVPARLPAELAAARIGAVTGESGGDLWIATRGQGLFQWQPHTGQLVRYRANPLDPAAAGDDDLTALHIDRRRDVWVGTARNGVFRLPRTEVGEPGAKKVRYRSIAGDPESLSNDSVTVIAEDREGRTWIGTMGGLNGLRTGPAGARHLFDRFLPGAHILAVHDDGAGHLWVGTQGRGLLRFAKREVSVAPYPEALGFPQSAVMGILGDDSGRLWVSTNDGLACFDPATETFRHYFASDGLPSGEFLPGAVARGRNGRLYFGSSEGVASFQPGELVPDPHVPAIVLTGIFRSGRPARPDELRGPPGPAGERTIGMTAGEDLTLTFAALDYINPSRNEYAYRLEPVQPDWIWLGHERRLTFAGLKPGSYKLSVKGTNGDGVWNPEGTSLRLRVRVPLWRSDVFRIVILLAGGGALLFLFRRGRRRRRAAASNVSGSETAGRP